MKIEMKKMVRLGSRTGRELQRYDCGRRQVVGCIPYRYANTKQTIEGLEVLLVSSQKGQQMMFPKGGWETDESMEAAVLRETAEEAGVTGIVQSKLNEWIYKSKSRDILHDGHMFPLLVTEQFEIWPEIDNRQRRWVKVAEARELLGEISWMIEALDFLVQRLTEQNEKSTDTARQPTSDSNLVESKQSFRRGYGGKESKASFCGSLSTFALLVPNRCAECTDSTVKRNLTVGDQARSICVTD